MSFDGSHSLPKPTRGFFLFRLSFVFTMVAVSLGALLLAYGLEIGPDRQEILRNIAFIGPGLWALRALFPNWKHKRIEYWPHSLLAVFLIIELVTFRLTGKGVMQSLISYDLGLIDNFFLLSITFAVAVSLGFEVLENSRLGRIMIKSHARSFLYLMIILVLAGTSALLLPNMSAGTESFHLSDAFFCATGASTLTSLTSVTSAYLSAQGEIVRLVLMQSAVMLILGYSAFLFILYRQKNLHNDFADSTLINSSEKTIKKIFACLVIIELVGAIVLFGVWDQNVKFSGLAGKLFDSVYHSVSAISNCGLSTFEDGFQTTSTLRQNYLAHWLIMALAFIGSIGFIVLIDLFSRKSIKARLEKPMRRITAMTSWVLFGTAGLVLSGALVYFILEKDGVGLAEHQNIFGGMTTSIFQSIMSTSGFATSDWGKGWWITMSVLFIIGGSYMGSAGGFRVENIVRILKPAAKIGLGSIRKMGVLFVLWNISAIGLLYFSETHIISDSRWGMDTIIYEQLSAFCNAGHSAGITSQLSLLGQIIIILTMFVGRVSFLYIIGRSLVKSVDEKLPIYEPSLNN